MKSKSYRHVFKVSLITALVLALTLVGYVACQENDTDEKPFNGNAASHQVSAGKSSSMVISTVFHENVGAAIPHDMAKRWKEAYKKQHPDGLESHFFGSAIIQRLLSQPNVAGISIQYALDDEGVPQLILVGIDKTGRKMTAANEFEADRSYHCPSDCAPEEL
jgi:hypothetical protein